MKTERQLINKYAEFMSVLTDAEIGFKRKEAKEKIEQINVIYKEIVMLRRRLIKEHVKEESEDLQMKIKFRKRN